MNWIKCKRYYTETKIQNILAISLIMFPVKGRCMKINIILKLRFILFNDVMISNFWSLFLS